MASRRKHNALTGFCQHVIERAAGNSAAKHNRNQNNHEVAKVFTLLHCGDYLANYQWLGQANCGANHRQDNGNDECALVLGKVWPS